MVEYVVDHIPGGRPSLAYINAVANVFKSFDNWRPLQEGKNKGTYEKALPRKLIEASEKKEPLPLTGHELIKAQHMVDFVVANKEKLPEGFVNTFARLDCMTM